MVQLRAVDYDHSDLQFILQYAWRWADGDLVLGDPGVGKPYGDHLTVHDSEWLKIRVDLFGNGFVTDRNTILTAGRINRVELYEGFQFSPFLPAGSHELRLSLAGISLAPATLSRVFDSAGTQDDIALIRGLFSGNDRLRLTGDNWVSGHAGNDTIVSGDGADTLDGGTGNDVIRSGAGDDILFLDPGNDRLDGGSGNDSLVVDGMQGAWIDLASGAAQRTGWGLDVIAGFENVYGDGGNDRFSGNAGANILVGNGGHDRLNGRDGNDSLRGMAGDDSLNGAVGNDQLFGDGGQDHLIGGSGDDTLYGDSGDDLLKGDGGRDNLYGGAGADTLHGGSDRLTDDLHGGRGEDVFLFRSLGPSNVGYADTIWDFRPGSDRIDLSAIDADPTDPGDDAFVITGMLRAAPGGQIAITQTSLYDVEHTIIQIDTDADAAPEMVIDILGHVTLTRQDFIL